MFGSFPKAKSALLLAACVVQAPGLGAAFATDQNSISAEIRYTSYGIPHVKASSFEGLGFGLAYAFARDNVCLLAEQFVTLRGERALHLGREGRYRDGFAEMIGGAITNVESDYFHKLMYADVAAHQKAGAGSEVRAMVTGYVRGYNKYIEDEKARLPAACAGADWVRPIDEDDLYRRFLQAQVLGGLGGFLIPVSTAMEGTRAGPVTKPDDTKTSLRSPSRDGLGSNAIAFGSKFTPDGRGMLFSNPHFPWQGAERIYQMQLTIPGKYSVMGASLYGIPVPQLGFSKDVSWTLTWTPDAKSLIRRIKLNEANPRQYYVDGKLHDMKATRIEIAFRREDGTIGHESRVAYSTRYGPLVGGAYFPGSKSEAFAVTDLNYHNNRAYQSYFEISKAKTVKEIDASQNRLMALPFSMVTAVDAAGTAYFSNKAVVPYITDAQIEQCVNNPMAKMYRDTYDTYVLDGSVSACDPLSGSDSPQPGVMPGSKKPYIFRSDYVAQSNDSHWIVNADPSSFLEGFNSIMGDERTQRGERLRVAIDFLRQRATNADGLGGNAMTPDRMRRIFYRARLIEAESMIGDLIADCRANPKMKIADTNEVVDVSAACNALARWDASENVDSIAGHIFREFYNNLQTPGMAGGMRPDVWKIPFDAGKPLTTPSGLNASDFTRSALAKAVKYLTDNGIALDAKLGDIQFVERNGEKLPISGGRGYHNIRMTFQKGRGYTDPVTFGDSYIHIVHLGSKGPSGYWVNAYSQSVNPQSPHAADQTRLYSRGEWPKIRFSEAEIAADPEYRVVRVQSPAGSK